ncbi:MAG: hypothetical protein KDK01_15660 [Rhodobacteraceae bacterium]|nr:hypothetical protein [Paracoccaceae bacterium]
MSLRACLSRFTRLVRQIAFVTGVGAVCAAVPMTAMALPPALPGSEAPEFTQALDVWLADDEAAALPVLAQLARDGNQAARILLGLIDKTPALQGPYLSRLSRSERIALLREPGGMSGRNWLLQVEDVPLVAAWMALWDVDADLSVIDRFQALGEPRAARVALIVLAAREHPALARIPLDQADPELLYLLWRSVAPETRAAIQNLMPAGHPQRLLIGDRVDAREIDTWLSASAAAAPISSLCNAVCPDSGETCRGAAYRVLNSHNALLTLGTPSEALISQTAFLASPRGQSTVMRRILLSTDLRGRRAMLAYLREHTECLADAMQIEHQRYLPRIPNLPGSN